LHKDRKDEITKKGGRINHEMSVFKIVEMGSMGSMGGKEKKKWERRKGEAKN
jgi:hypothetical protein